MGLYKAGVKGGLKRGIKKSFLNELIRNDCKTNKKHYQDAFSI